MNFTLRLVSCFVLCISLFQCHPNKSKKWVYDFERVLSLEQAHSLDSLFSAHEAQTSNEIVLVTTDTYFPDSSILFYSINFGRRQRIGKKGLNNGVVIVFSNTQGEARISTGYGLENILKDEKAREILDSIMIPQFEAGDLYSGLWQGSVAIVRFLEQPGNRIISK